MVQHYGNPHMGCPIDSLYHDATFPFMGTIGARIRGIRKAVGLTQPALAKSIGIDQSTLSDIERGAGFSAETLMRLAEELGTTCEFIMRGQINTSPRIRAAQTAVAALSDEERLALFTAIQQPPIPDEKAAKHLPPAPVRPASFDTNPAKKKPLSRKRAA
jgi:transcriptional regulator with XRE-family HTH domain